MKKVVVIGGGTGTYVVLTGIKKYALDISAIVSMMDSGGSTGRLRDQLGVLPPGDFRQCLVALSEASDLWRRLFLYRFTGGDLRGHNFGNIFLTALEKSTGDYQEVVDTASYILQTKGQVIPVTFDKVNLCAQYSDGEILESEELIDTAADKKSRIVRAYLQPAAKANKKAIESITSADYIIMGPGDLYTSLIPNLLVEGVGDAIKKSRAKIITIVNLMTKAGQTSSYTAADHVTDLEYYCKRPVDYVLLNNKRLPTQITSYYGTHGEIVVKDDMGGDARVLRFDLLSDLRQSQVKADDVKRSIVRHDSDKIGKAVSSIVL